MVAAIDFHGALTGTGSYAPPPEARGGSHKGGGVGPSPSYSYSAQVADVSVDEETGEVTVHKIWAAHDCGRALNPVSVEGQIIGSVWMGLGQALEEEMIWKDGLLMNPGPARIPLAVGHRVARDRAHHRREHRSRRPVRRQGVQRRLAGRDDSGDLQCDLRRRRHSPARSAVHARARAGRDARARRCREEARPDRKVSIRPLPRISASMAARCGSKARDRRGMSLIRRDKLSAAGGRRRLSLPEFKLLRPRTLAEAVDLLGIHADAQIVAGGTDLVPSLKQRLFTPAYVHRHPPHRRAARHSQHPGAGN